MERQHSEELKQKLEASKQTNPFKIGAISKAEQSSITDAVVDFVIEDDERKSVSESL